ncbi:peptidoglycan recognition family protein [Saccharothrix sp. HUAS TT1]|uniref:peptidoglycan recognition protein family protein n=1 Tax=unclassified Saccharothrix TaxID=2593673 RepID=UPI00345BD067
MVTRRALVLGVGAVVGPGASTWPHPVVRRRVERCAEWGARPPVEPPAPVSRPPERIVVHHTATPNVADGSRRHGSLDALLAGDRMVEGAHAYGQNRKPIGIETEGTYVDEIPPAVQWDALVWLRAEVALELTRG